MRNPSSSPSASINGAKREMNETLTPSISHQSVSTSSYGNETEGTKETDLPREAAAEPPFLRGQSATHRTENANDVLL